MTKHKASPRVARLAKIFASVTEEEARAIYKALGQYVENQGELVETSAPGDLDLTEVTSLKKADAVLQRLDAEMASLAE